MKKYEIDMCNGPLFGKIISFAVPLLLSNLLQLFFNAADIMVAGRFAGTEALAAVGATASLINLMLNLFIGLSVGVNVLAARYFATANKKSMQDLVHTTLPFAVLGGFALIILGFFIARPVLLAMDTPSEVIDQAALYLKIYCCGMPVALLYNFGNAIFRAVGDTKRPLYYLAISGVVNVVLNIFFVTQLHMGVAGVALATVISQVLSAALLMQSIIKTDSIYKFEIKKISIKAKPLLQVISIGLPAGIQGCLFSLSNILIQSSINYFGATAMAGSTAATNVENFVYMAMNAFNNTTLSFVSQNFGAGKYDRIKKVQTMCLGLVFGVGFAMGTVLVAFGEPLLGIFATDPKAIAQGMIKLRYVCGMYFICGIMEVLVGGVRGLGAALLPTVVSLLGACGLRIVWIFTIFEWHKTLDVLYLSYPISWVITAIAHAICLVLIFKKQQKRYESLKSQQQSMPPVQ